MDKCHENGNHFYDTQSPRGQKPSFMLHLPDYDVPLLFMFHISLYWQRSHTIYILFQKNQMSGKHDHSIGDYKYEHCQL